MDGAWRRPPKSLADYGHTEPKRGAEWWGKSALLTFALFESEPPSGRNPKWPLPQQWICTRYNSVDCEAVIAGKPAPTVGSRGCQLDRCRLSGRLRRQASSHSLTAGCQVGMCRLSGRHGGKMPCHRWTTVRLEHKKRCDPRGSHLFYCRLAISYPMPWTPTRTTRPRGLRSLARSIPKPSGWS